MPGCVFAWDFFGGHDVFTSIRFCADAGIAFAFVLLFSIACSSGGEMNFLEGEGPGGRGGNDAFARMLGGGGGPLESADLETIRFLLAKERNLTVEEHGGKIILDGRVTSESVRKRIDKLAENFKNLLDLTEYLQEEDSILADAALIKKKIEARLNRGFEQPFSFAPQQIVNFEVVNNDIIIMGELNNDKDVEMAEQIAKTYNPKVVNHLLVREQSIELAVIFARVTYRKEKNVGINLLQPTLVTLPSLTWAATNEDGKSFSKLFNGRRWAASDLIIDPNGEDGQRFYNHMAVDDNATILARPHLTALNGTPARFVSGGERMIFNTVGDTADTEYKEYGFILEVTPTLTSNGRIHLQIKMSFLSPLGESDFMKFEHSSAAIVAANQGMALSGIIKELYDRNFDGVPGLRRIPLLKHFFSKKGKYKENEELVVMVFPLMPTAIMRAPYIDATDTAPIVDDIMNEKIDVFREPKQRRRQDCADEDTAVREDEDPGSGVRRRFAADARVPVVSSKDFR